MKTLRLVFFIVLGLFTLNILSAQELLSLSGVIHKIPGYPDEYKDSDASIYGHLKIAVSKPEECSRLELRCYYGSNKKKTISFDFSTVDGETYYKMGGISRLVKRTGVILEADLEGIITGWEDSKNKISVTVYNKSNVEVAGNWIPLTYKVWE